MEPKVKRTFELLDHCASQYKDQTAYVSKLNGKWVSVTYNEFQEKAILFAKGLIELGVKKLENVATIFSVNLPEWNTIDMGISITGAVHIPIYPTISDSDYLYILGQANVKHLFVSDQFLYNKIVRLQSELPVLKKIYSIEKLSNVDNWEEVLLLGEDSGVDTYKELQRRGKTIKSSDIVSIIYTSGTTGFPKGVMLSHENLLSNMYVAAKIQPVGNGKKVLSFLPLCHIYERTANYQFHLKGCQIYYCENLKSVMENFREIQPDATTVVPRVLEKIVKGILAAAEQGGFLKSLVVQWAVNFGFRFKPHRRIGFLYRFWYKIADIVVYRRVRALLGGKLSYVGCGGAPIDKKLEQFFWASGIPVYQGYGLTECSPLISLNFPGKKNFRLGTVGPVIEGVQVKISADGEILCKGPNVMKGYYKQEKLTRETIKEGWMHTGDVGKIIKKKYLKITGRKKQMFKTSYGKYIVPQAIENKFANSTIIDHLVVIGEGKHCAAAIVSPNFLQLRIDLRPKDSKISNADLILRTDVKNKIKKEIDTVNRQLGKTEQIKMHLVVSDEWSVETREISPTFKIRRGIILNKYRRHIFEMYKDESIM